MAEQVEYGGTWWHRKDDGSIYIYRANGSEWVRWSPGDADSPPPHFLGAGPVVTVAPARKGEAALGSLVMGMILIGGIVLLFNWCSGMLESSKTDAPEGEFTASVLDFQALDDANLRVNFKITNDGTTAAKAECTFAAKDIGGFTIGFDSLVGVNVPPSQSKLGNVILRIEDEGAFRVQKVSVRDC